MDAILSSFCFTKDSLAESNSYFHRLPPVCFKTWNRFVPDYSILFLCEKFYLDGPALERIEREPLFAKHLELVNALRDCGRLEVRDFRAEVAPFASTIRSHVDSRLAHLPDWSESFSQVIQKWDRFYEQVVANYSSIWTEEEAKRHKDVDYDDGLLLDAEEKWPEERKILASMEGGMYEGLEPGLIETLTRWDEEIPEYYRDRAVGVISSYVEHVAASLCLSDVLNATIHDWEDIGPIYEAVVTDTLRISARKQLSQQQQVNALINVMFPDFEPRNATALAKALDDKRVGALRSLVDASLRGEVVFNVEFANGVLRKVLEAGKKSEKARRVTGWLTKPLGFIPYAGFFAESAANSVVERLIKKKAQQEHSWFYLLSEINS